MECCFGMGSKCCVGVFYVSSGWFGYTEPYPTVASQEEQGVEGNCTQIPGGPTALNHFEPPHAALVEVRNVVEGCLT